jgi:hypothetical protein
VKLAVPFEIRIFLVVILVGLISVLVILDTPVSEPQVSARVIQGLQQPGEPSDTLIISGIDIGQNIGFKSPTISGNEFACMADRKITTDRGRATAKYFLSLYDTVNGGCSVEFRENEQSKAGLFMYCPSSEKTFDFTILFEPSLDSDIDDGELEDILQEDIPMLGTSYTIIKADVNTGTNTLRIRFIGPMGTFEVQDNYADNAFSEQVETNGKRAMNAQVRIRATANGDEFMIQSIEYRLFAQPAVGKDVTVADHQGTKQHLRTPEAFLGDFDILFRGLGGTPPKVSTPKAKIVASNAILFDAVGDDQYNLVFTNNRGQRYKFPIASVESGALAYGDGDKDFEYTGAGNIIDHGDIFAVTDRATRNGVTNIVEYSSADLADGKAYFNDLSSGQSVGTFDTTTGDGTVNFGGNSYAFNVDVADPNLPIAMDFDHSGAVGGEAQIVTAGGPRLDLAGGVSGALEIDESLFADEAPAGGESINFAVSEDNGDIDIDITSGVTLIKNDASGKREGLSQFGVFVQRDNRQTANDLLFALPSGQTGGAISIQTSNAPAGQAQGEVLVTCERSEFAKKAQAAKSVTIAPS